MQRAGGKSRPPCSLSQAAFEVTCCSYVQEPSLALLGQSEGHPEPFTPRGGASCCPPICHRPGPWHRVEGGLGRGRRAWACRSSGWLVWLLPCEGWPLLGAARPRVASGGCPAGPPAQHGARDRLSYSLLLGLVDAAPEVGDLQTTWRLTATGPAGQAGRGPAHPPRCGLRPRPGPLGAARGPLWLEDTVSESSGS